MVSIQCLVVTVSHCWFMTKSANPVPTQPGGGGGVVVGRVQCFSSCSIFVALCSNGLILFKETIYLNDSKWFVCIEQIRVNTIMKDAYFRRII